MRPKICLLAFLLLTLPLAAEGGGFRGSEWGESEAAVREKTGAGASSAIAGEGLKALFVNDRMAGLDAFAIYLLDRDRLVQTKYLFPQNYLEGEQFLDDFARVEEVLREQYGTPAESGEVWRDRQDIVLDRSAWVRMIAVGQLAIVSRWETAETVITHILNGENLDIDHEINYVSKKFGKAAGKAIEKIRPPKEFRF